MAPIWLASTGLGPATSAWSCRHFRMLAAANPSDIWGDALDYCDVESGFKSRQPRAFNVARETCRRVLDPRQHRIGAAITSRSTTTTTDMARELTQRLTALGRAHDLVRPLPGREGKAALFGDLMALLAPYDDLGAFSGRVRVAVPRMGVGEKSATTLALIIHELATNSLKYGALSSATGTLDVSSTIDNREVVLVWTERGGPNVVAPDTAGYGSKLVAALWPANSVAPLNATGRLKARLSHCEWINRA